MSPRSRYNRIRMHGIANLRESGVVPPRRELRRSRSMQAAPCPTVVLSQGGRCSRSCPTRATRSRAASAFASLQSDEFDELCRVSYPQGGHFIFFPPMRIAARNEYPAPDPAKAGHLGRRSAWPNQWVPPAIWRQTFSHSWHALTHSFMISSCCPSHAAAQSRQASAHARWAYLE